MNVFSTEQKRIRRTSAQTDTSVHTDTESPASESETEELSRTRSGIKSDESDVKLYKKKILRTSTTVSFILLFHSFSKITNLFSSIN